jgi:hypothetical protein
MPSSSSSWDPALCGSSSVLLAKASPLHVRHRAEIEEKNRHAQDMTFVSKIRGKSFDASRKKFYPVRENIAVPRRLYFPALQ